MPVPLPAPGATHCATCRARRDTGESCRLHSTRHRPGALPLVSPLLFMASRDESSKGVCFKTHASFRKGPCASLFCVSLKERAKMYEHELPRPEQLDKPGVSGSSTAARTARQGTPAPFHGGRRSSGHPGSEPVCRTPRPPSSPTVPSRLEHKACAPTGQLTSPLCVRRLLCEGSA